MKTTPYLVFFLLVLFTSCKLLIPFVLGIKPKSNTEVINYFNKKDIKNYYLYRPIGNKELNAVSSYLNGANSLKFYDYQGDLIAQESPTLCHNDVRKIIFETLSGKVSKISTQQNNNFSSVMNNLECLNCLNDDTLKFPNQRCTVLISVLTSLADNNKFSDLSIIDSINKLYARDKVNILILNMDLIP